MRKGGRTTGEKVLIGFLGVVLVGLIGLSFFFILGITGHVPYKLQFDTLPDDAELSPDWSNFEDANPDVAGNEGGFWWSPGENEECDNARESRDLACGAFLDEFEDARCRWWNFIVKRNCFDLRDECAIKQVEMEGMCLKE